MIKAEPEPGPVPGAKEQESPSLTPDLETQLVDAPYPPRAAEPTATLGNHAETVEALFAGRSAATDIPLLRTDGVSESTRPTGGVTPAALAISGAPVDRDGIGRGGGRGGFSVVVVGGLDGALCSGVCVLGGSRRGRSGGRAAGLGF